MKRSFLRVSRVALGLLAAAGFAGCGTGAVSGSGAPVATGSASISATSFGFGDVFAGSTVTKAVATVTNTGGTPLTLGPTLSGAASFALVPTAPTACGSTLAVGAQCSVAVSFSPAAAGAQTASLSLGFGSGTAVTTAALAGKTASATEAELSGNVDGTIGLSGVSDPAPVGTVSSTANPQVAQYSVSLPAAGSVTVDFGTTTSYGHKTWTQSTATAGTVTILVAGMLPNTTYHMQAAVQLSGGSTATDADHTFASGTPLLQPGIYAQTTPGLSPQNGLEELTFLEGNTFGLVVTDLQANILWTYAPPDGTPGTFIQGAKLMANGDWLLGIGGSSSAPAQNMPLPANGLIAIREIDLAGTVKRQITVAQLNAELATAGYSLNLLDFHHDVTPLPNGHWLVLANTAKTFTNLTGLPGATTVVGDVIVDLDENLQPVWVWNEFDHLDVNRHPMNFPDWTHTNAVIYSPTDGNLIVSIRHQNWVVKVDYENGAGSGNILWRLGEGGDFTLVGGSDPQDWQYAQHKPSLFSPNSAGVFSLGLMDNGDDREFAPGVVCNTAGNPACLYTTVPIFQIDETNKTAALVYHEIIPPSLYSNFGGNAELLDNGDYEFDLAGTAASDIYEVLPSNSQAVWHLHASTSNAYRGYRISSLYPGVNY